jgi:phosphoribosyl 1,2-cyclic phosphodiesterase
VFGCPFAQASVKQMISKIMAPPNFPVKFEDIRADINFHETCESPFTIESMTITPIPLSHPNQGIGYKFAEDGKSFVFLTDNELMFKHPGGVSFQDYRDFSVDTDLLIHDAEFTQEEYKKTRTWGHSVYKDALKLALDARVKRFGLFHHNQERSDKGIDEILEDCRQIVEINHAGLDCFALHQGMEIEL